jgi:galactokinase
MKQRIADKFSEIYREGGDVQVYFAPGRVNLIGEHTDYNGGHVFPCAITIGTYAAARKREDSLFHFYSMNYPEQGVLEVSLDDLDYREEDGWGNYPKGVVRTFLNKGYQIRTGVDILYYGEIPKGLGIGSSASMEVATGLILRDLLGFQDLSMIDIALFSQLAENEYMGMNCGIMDPFSIAMGKKDHAIFLDTSDLSYKYAPLKLPHEKIIITNSGKDRVAVDARYQERRSQCEEALAELQTVVSIHDLSELTAEVFEQVQEMIKSPVRVKRARHAVTENQRTIQAVEALERGDVQEFGQLMNASHLSLKEDYEVTCEELDILVEEAWNVEGVIGSRMMGAGFGGCTVSIVEDRKVNDFIRIVGQNYEQRTGRHAEFYVVETGNGATRL